MARKKALSGLVANPRRKQSWFALGAIKQRYRIRHSNPVLSRIGAENPVKDARKW
jgi:hypothetical protein